MDPQTMTLRETRGHTLRFGELVDGLIDPFADADSAEAELDSVISGTEDVVRELTRCRTRASELYRRTVLDGDLHAQYELHEVEARVQSLERLMKNQEAAVRHWESIAIAEGQRARIRATQILVQRRALSACVASGRQRSGRVGRVATNTKFKGSRRGASRPSRRGGDSGDPDLDEPPSQRPRLLDGCGR